MTSADTPSITTAELLRRAQRLDTMTEEGAKATILALSGIIARHRPVTRLEWRIVRWART